MSKSDIREYIPIFIEGNKIYGESFSNALARKYLNNCFRWSKTRFCAILNDKVIGFVMASEFIRHDGKHCFIENFFVDNEHQNKGVGTVLLKRVESEARKRRMLHIKLSSRKGSKAFKFYKKNGFCPTGWVYMDKRLKH